MVKITKNYFKDFIINLHTDKEFKALLISILKKADHIEGSETLTLTPHHFITVGGKPISHYRINCGRKKFFLKSVKDNDNTVFCLPYLYRLLKELALYQNPHRKNANFQNLLSKVLYIFC